MKQQILWVGNLSPEQNSCIRMFLRSGDRKSFHVSVEVYVPFVTDTFGMENQLEVERQ